MSYAKAIKHWKNHCKDKYFQQCGFAMSEKGIKSYATIAEETAESYYIFDEATQQRVTNNFTEWNDAVDAFYEIFPILHSIKIYTNKGMVIAQ